MTRKKYLARNDFVYKKGDPSEVIYFIKEGEV
jgi:CRP-like cAMP-binding protein